MCGGKPADHCTVQLYFSFVILWYLLGIGLIFVFFAPERRSLHNCSCNYISAILFYMPFFYSCLNNTLFRLIVFTVVQLVFVFCST
uniref:Uncharacterized protein n=1 Tax=Anguilla anguilla TaxID=7936 RepID=A0A0E9R8G1_ANGAN